MVLLIEFETLTLKMLMGWKPGETVDVLVQ